MSLLKVVTLLEWYFWFAFIVQKFAKLSSISVFIIPEIISESMKLFVKVWSMHVALVRENLVSNAMYFVIENSELRYLCYLLYLLFYEAFYKGLPCFCLKIK